MVFLLSYCFTFTEENKEEETQPQKTANHYLASFFYPLFTRSDMKPDNWVYVVAISLRNFMFPNVSVNFKYNLHHVSTLLSVLLFSRYWSSIPSIEFSTHIHSFIENPSVTTTKLSAFSMGICIQNTF